MSTINELCKKACDIAKSKGWDDNKSFGELIALVHSELSESLEDYRKGYKENEIYFEGEKPCGIPSELADVIIRVFDIAGRYSIDLENAINVKLEHNAKRSYKHGGKKI